VRSKSEKLPLQSSQVTHAHMYGRLLLLCALNCLPTASVAVVSLLLLPLSFFHCKRASATVSAAALLEKLSACSKGAVKLKNNKQTRARLVTARKIVCERGDH